jgi:hypothetical protein
MDFGVASLKNVFMSLQANRELIPITEVGWQNYQNVNPDGHYLVGYPDEDWKPHSSISQIGRDFFIDLVTALVCVPVQKLARRPADDPKDFWNHPTSFYGEIMPLPDGLNLDDIVGLSGGPILSIERTPEGELKYRLAGIQSAWLKGKRIIRAESMADIELIMRST